MSVIVKIADNFEEKKECRQGNVAEDGIQDEAKKNVGKQHVKFSWYKKIGLTYE